MIIPGIIPSDILCCQCQTYHNIENDSTECLVCNHSFCNQPMTISSRRMRCGQIKYHCSVSTSRILISLYIITSLLLYVSAVIIGYRMPHYPQFLSYFTTGVATIIFAIIGIIFKEQWWINKELNIQFMWMGLWMALTRIFWQYAVPHIDTELSNVLSQMIYPVTWVSAWYMFRWEVSVIKIISFFSMLISILIVIVPSFFTNSSIVDDINNNGTSVDDINNDSYTIWWIFLSLLSTIPAALLTTYQERAFKEMKASILACLFYYNLYCFIILLITVPLEWSTTSLITNSIWSYEWDAFNCFFTNVVNKHCHIGATIWTMIYIISYVGMFFLGAILLLVKDSSLIANVHVICVPGAAVILWFSVFVGADAEDPTLIIIISLILITLNAIFYDRYCPEESDLIPQDPIGHVISTTFLSTTIIPANFRALCEHHDV